MRRYLLSVLGVLLVGLGAAQGAVAVTTTLTFDGYANGTILTTEYQGVTVSGVSVLDANVSPWPANSGANLATAPTGFMTFTVNSTITGNVQSVSAYISGVTSIGVFAFDAVGNLVGQSFTSGATNNMLVSVTSSGNPIVTVLIHDGGSEFAIDTLTFIGTAPPPAVKNVKPIADAGNRQKVRIGSLVTLDGSRSVDPDHQPQPLTYRWTQVFGPRVALSGATTARPTFTPSGKQHLYVFSLVVNDGKDNSKVSLVLVIASKKGDLNEQDVGGSVYSNPYGN